MGEDGEMCMGSVGLGVGEMRLETDANRASSQETVETLVHFLRNFWMDRWKFHHLHGQNTRVKMSLSDMGVGQRQVARTPSP